MENCICNMKNYLNDDDFKYYISKKIERLKNRINVLCDKEKLSGYYLAKPEYSVDNYAGLVLEANSDFYEIMHVIDTLKDYIIND